MPGEEAANGNFLGEERKMEEKKIVNRSYPRTQRRGREGTPIDSQGPFTLSGSCGMAKGAG